MFIYYKSPITTGGFGARSSTTRMRRYFFASRLSWGLRAFFVDMRETCLIDAEVA